MKPLFLTLLVATAAALVVVALSVSTPETVVDVARPQTSPEPHAGPVLPDLTPPPEQSPSAQTLAEVEASEVPPLGSAAQDSEDAATGRRDQIKRLLAERENREGIAYMTEQLHDALAEEPRNEDEVSNLAYSLLAQGILARRRALGEVYDDVNRALAVDNTNTARVVQVNQETFIMMPDEDLLYDEIYKSTAVDFEPLTQSQLDQIFESSQAGLAWLR